MQYYSKQLLIENLILHLHIPYLVLQFSLINECFQDHLNQFFSQKLSYFFHFIHPLLTLQEFLKESIDSYYL